MYQNIIWCVSVPTEERGGGGGTNCMYIYVTMQLLAVRVRLDTLEEFITLASCVKGRQ